VPVCHDRSFVRPNPQTPASRLPRRRQRAPRVWGERAGLPCSDRQLGANRGSASSRSDVRRSLATLPTACVQNIRCERADRDVDRLVTRIARRGPLDNQVRIPVVAIERKTRSCDQRHLDRVREQVTWLSRRRRRWACNGALGFVCIVRARGVERVEHDVVVVSTACRRSFGSRRGRSRLPFGRLGVPWLVGSRLLRSTAGRERDRSEASVLDRPRRGRVLPGDSANAPALPRRDDRNSLQRVGDVGSTKSSRAAQTRWLTRRCWSRLGRGGIAGVRETGNNGCKLEL
jgi:hypothetical protein